MVQIPARIWRTRELIFRLCSGENIYHRGLFLADVPSYSEDDQNDGDADAHSNCDMHHFEIGELKVRCCGSTECMVGSFEPLGGGVWWADGSLARRPSRMDNVATRSVDCATKTLGGR
jgi:hypothetical protein